MNQARDILEERETEERQAQEDLISKRDEDEQQSGKKKNGRKPKSPDEVVNHKRKANVTDTESRIMKGR